MNRDFQIRFTAGLLFLLTTAACRSCLDQFPKRARVPDSLRRRLVGGARTTAAWSPTGWNRTAPATRPAFEVGDQLTAINQHDVKDTAALERQLYRVGAWSKATYSLVRQSVPVDSVVILVPADRSLNDWLRLIALIYLGIGLYVLLRRWTAPSSTHFYIFCLVSFIFYSFHYTGKLNEFDWTIYWCNVVAWMLQPALFLHFVLTFPEKREFVRKHRWVIPAIYVPGSAAAGDPHSRAALAEGQRTAALEPGPAGDGLPGAVLRGRGGGAVEQLPPGQHADPAPAAEVGHARHHSGDRALHAVLRDSVPDRDRCRHRR